MGIIVIYNNWQYCQKNQKKQLIMEFDFKITTWERVTVSKEKEKEVLDKIKKGEIVSADDIFDVDKNAHCKKIDDVDEQMTVEENSECSTIEVLNSEGVTIFKNGL